MPTIFESIDDLFALHAIEKKNGEVLYLGELQGENAFSLLRERVREHGLLPQVAPHGGLVELRFVTERERPQLNIKLPALLLLATLATTLIAGALQQGSWNPFRPAIFSSALAFSLFLLGILGLHETGHFFLARRHGVAATLPFFIPAPTLIGTFGAVIRIQSPIPHRRALLDIGAAGPIFGFLVALAAAAIGLSLSHAVPKEVTQGSGLLRLGDSLVFLGFEKMFHLGGASQEVILHPIAFAAWIGFFVTALNLIPIGQFDGGHILYALFPRQHLLLSRATQGLLLLLGFFWPGWWVWALISFVFPVRHQGCLNEIAPVGKREKAIALFSLLMLILCFSPVPFSLG